VPSRSARPRACAVPGAGTVRAGHPLRARLTLQGYPHACRRAHGRWAWQPQRSSGSTAEGDAAPSPQGACARFMAGTPHASLVTTRTIDTAWGIAGGVVSALSNNRATPEDRTHVAENLGLPVRGESSGAAPRLRLDHNDPETSAPVCGSRHSDKPRPCSSAWP